MKRSPGSAAPALAVVLTVVLLVGCSANSGTAQTPSSSSPARSSTQSPSASQPTSSSQSPSPTPAISQAIDAAVAVVASKGYADCNSSLYEQSPLHALICVATGRASSTTQLAFFFVGSRYLGTDTVAPSARIIGPGWAGWLAFG